LPTKFVLTQNYPNPFNPATTIRFGLPADAHVVLSVYNTLGQQVAQPGGGILKAGYHEFVWDGKTDDGTAVASGVYFYRLSAVLMTQLAPPGAGRGEANLVRTGQDEQTGAFVDSKKMLLLR
jgi:flagellar hook assembly protein FlgD